MLMVSDPIVVHVVPLLEYDAVMVVPLRVKRTQYGAAPVFCVLVETPPVAVRRWNAIPELLETIIIPCLEPAVRDSRIITPAFAQALVLLTPVTFAVIIPSPLKV